MRQLAELGRDGSIQIVVTQIQLPQVREFTNLRRQHAPQTATWERQAVDTERRAAQVNAVPGGHGPFRRPAELSRTGQSRLEKQENLAVSNQPGVRCRIGDSDTRATAGNIDRPRCVMDAPHIESAGSAESD